MGYLANELYCIVCRSEAFRYILMNVKGEDIHFRDCPIMESEDRSLKKEIINRGSDKHIYASPTLIKGIKVYVNAEMCGNAADCEEKVEQIQCEAKQKIVNVILKDYRKEE